MTTTLFRRPVLAALLATMLATMLALGAPARDAAAEVNEVRFVRQLGLGYLQIYLLEDLRLVEKHAAAAGLTVRAGYTALGLPSALNDALLSDSADLVAAGITPFITLWDRTRGKGDVKALAALNSQPAFLNTTNPAVRTIADFTDKDRIALPSVKVAYQATILQMAAEKAFGQFDRLDPLTVSLAHPDATAALLSGHGDITAHFTSPPFQYQQLANPRVHRVLSSYEVLGGPATFSGLWTTTKFHDANPRLIKAILAALEEANGIIHADPRRAAEVYVRLDRSRLSAEEVETLLRDPDIFYTIAPQHITRYTDFMARAGTIAKAPASWKDLFFPEIHHLAGS
jgi:NitT/TauT family transport system substrate-binding protein